MLRARTRLLAFDAHVQTINDPYDRKTAIFLESRFFPSHSFISPFLFPWYTLLATRAAGQLCCICFLLLLLFGCVENLFILFLHLIISELLAHCVQHCPYAPNISHQHLELFFASNRCLVRPSVSVVLVHFSYLLMKMPSHRWRYGGQRSGRAL